MTKDNLVETLVNTRVNGNSIKGNKTYTNMLKRITKDDINEYYNAFVASGVLYGTKLEMIEQIRDTY